MEMIVIDSDRIKITLTADDMKKYSLGGEAFDFENTETRKQLRKILDEANRKTGFDIEPGKVLVQLYETCSGGCEIYVTRVPEPEVKTEKDGFYIIDGLHNVGMLCRRMRDLGAAWQFRILYGNGGWAVSFDGEEPVFAADYGESTEANRRLMAEEFYTALYGRKDIEMLSKL